MNQVQKIIFHSSVWLMVYLVPVIRWTFFLYPEKFHFHDYVQLVIQTIIHLSNFYLFYLLIFPLYFSSLSKWRFAIYVVAYMVAFAIARYYISHFVQDIFDTNFFVNKYYKTWYILTQTLFYTFLAAVMKLAIEWFTFRDKQKELVILQQQSELATLKAQINPHFLFNTLNNIYSLAQQNSEKTAQAVMMLSGMMRYMTREIENEKVLVEGEIEYVQSFIELQRLRISRPELIEFIVEGDYKNKKIAPMVLITFIENAFKHGKKLNEKGVRVSIKIDSQFLTLDVENHYNTGDSKSRDSSGLYNVVKRLGIIYGNRYKLKMNTNESSDIYSVNLKLPHL